MGLFSLEVPMAVALAIIIVVLLVIAVIAVAMKFNRAVHLDDLKMERVNSGFDQEGEERIFGAVK